MDERQEAWGFSIAYGYRIQRGELVRADLIDSCATTPK